MMNECEMAEFHDGQVSNRKVNFDVCI
jgi:hypothetical protein